MGKMRGEGEEEPYRFGEHGKGCCRKVHEAEATFRPREEGNVIIG